MELLEDVSKREIKTIVCFFRALQNKSQQIIEYSELKGTHKAQ